MKYLHYIPLVLAMMAFGPQDANASTTYGDLNNFDAVNDTGQECHGFEIEIEGVHSTEITYTYDWNHYGPPRITEGLSSSGTGTSVFIRYESLKNTDGTWKAFTAVPIGPMLPTDGHACTDPSVNQGCEHFGVGYYGAPTAMRYNWLVDYGGVLVHHTSPVMVGTPSFTYVPPAPAQPAVVAAVIPAPVVPIPPDNNGIPQFGEPSFVKVIKTTTHNANNVVLRDLVSDDKNGDGLNDWQNAEPAQVETDFKLLQANAGGNPAKQELQGGDDLAGDGSETVTRRYEFYKYGATADTRDQENGEAMCDEVDPTTNPNDSKYLHGVGNNVAVTDLYGVTYYVDCSAQIVVGEYIGAQMAGFDAAMPLGLVDHLQDAEKADPDPGYIAYTPRTVVVGGNTDSSGLYSIDVTGSLPPGLTLTADGVLSGTPTTAGIFNFTVTATDADNTTVSNSYVLTVPGDTVTPQYVLVVEKFGAGSGTVEGGGIVCGLVCDVLLGENTSVSLTETTAPGSYFTGWGGACTGTGACDFAMTADKGVSATFVPATLPYALTVTTSGSGTVTSSPKGINCGKQCSHSWTVGTNITLTAKPAKKHLFLGWTGGGCGTALTCTVPMLTNKDVTATFN
jgi:hypothetical protein